MARLIRTQKEVEGRVEEVWLVAEEDALTQWPAGPLAVVGHPTERADALIRARGEAHFCGDIHLPGMLHTAVLRSPHPRATVSSLDLSRAAVAPGVRGVIGPGECSALSGECNYEGQAVAAVCADSFAQAIAARRQIDVEWKVEEPLTDPERAIAQGQVLDRRSYRRGDPHAGRGEAAAVVSATYTTQTVLHSSMETHQAVCRTVGEGLEVYISTQYIWGVRAALAKSLGLDPDAIRVVCEYMGGGFGSKNSPGDYTLIAASLARSTGRPVRCALTRAEELLAAGNRNATSQRLVAGADADGTLTLLEGDYTNAVGWEGWSSLIEGPMQSLYACPNVQTVTVAAKLNLPPALPFRAPGFVEGTFGLECLLDELADELEIDPLALRRINHSLLDPLGGGEYSGKNLLACYDRAEAHWERRHAVRAASTDTLKRGVGLASGVWYGGGGPPSYAWVRVGSDGHVAVITAMQDVGTGIKTALGLIAAEELGVGVGQVTVSAGDSDRGPYATLSAGSSTLSSMGPATRAAAADAKQQILELAAQRYDADATALSLADGNVVFADGRAPKELAELLGLLGNGQILGTGARGPNPVGTTVLTFGVQIAEVAVDIATGEVSVERIAAIHDVGRVINPLAASSQVEGGIIQGIGHTLCEERLLDPPSARVLTRSLDAYRIPTIADVPEIVCELIDVPDTGLSNLGSKGIGEPPIIPVAAAIANAIRDATGAAVRSLPITRDQMLRSLAEAPAARHRHESAAAI